MWGPRTLNADDDDVTGLRGAYHILAYITHAL